MNRPPLALMLSPEPPEAGDERERELLRLAVDGAVEFEEFCREYRPFLPPDGEG